MLQILRLDLRFRVTAGNRERNASLRVKEVGFRPPNVRGYAGSMSMKNVSFWM
jgi:hypothetical protein